ncbi:unnamed protein product [Linum tenue]|uniref:Uncharacterized protein n=1 Tax=Linum tenue TaxID=586396 RepID=A0AAV0HWM4_9ROSI|nr:unnamed protein product [Linum tenue]
MQSPAASIVLSLYLRSNFYVVSFSTNTNLRHRRRIGKFLRKERRLDGYLLLFPYIVLLLFLLFDSTGEEAVNDAPRNNEHAVQDPEEDSEFNGTCLSSLTLLT